MDVGIANVSSSHSVEETMKKIRDLIDARGIRLFAQIDHSGEAERAGLSMRPTQLIVFGNPKGGTPVMVASPTAALDLPLKILVWEDGEGKVWVSYNTLEYLKARHGIPQELVMTLRVVETIAAEAAR